MQIISKYLIERNDVTMIQSEDHTPSMGHPGMMSGAIGNGLRLHYPAAENEGLWTGPCTIAPLFPPKAPRRESPLH
jgi:hypothetical protein